MNFAESGFRYDSFHDFPLGKYFDSVRQIMVGTVVFGEEFAKQWDNYFRVDGEQLLHGEAIRSSQFQDNQMSATYGINHYCNQNSDKGNRSWIKRIVPAESFLVFTDYDDMCRGK